MQRLLDLYTDYLLSSFGQVTATGLSKAVDGSISHDKITRMLSENQYTSKDLWKEVKPIIRDIANDSGCLIFDDSLLGCLFDFSLFLCAQRIIKIILKSRIIEFCTDDILFSYRSFC